MGIYKYLLFGLSCFLGLNTNVVNSNPDIVYDYDYFNDDLIETTHIIERDCNNIFNEDICLVNYCNWCIPSNELINSYNLYKLDIEYNNLFKGECLSNIQIDNDKLLNNIYKCHNLNLNIIENGSNYNISNDNIINNNFNDKLSYWYEFNKYMIKYNKKYKDNELHYKFIVFSNNLYKINNHEFNFNLDINEFADLTENEFKRFIPNHFLENNNNIKHLRKVVSDRKLNRSICKEFTPLKNSSTLLNEIDWRQLGAVGVPNDQGQCGSCWSFSASGAIEGAWAIKHGQFISLSEQHLIDCSSRYGNNGCQGGLMDNAFEYVIDNGGMCSEAEQPYEGKQNLFCKPCNNVVTISSCVDVTPNNQLHLKEAVSIGPVSIAIEADTSVFQFYSSGIIDSLKCGTNLDHGVLIVGYGNENGKDYWLVKNSWGINWGDGGFLKIARSSSTNDPGICGIAMQPSYPVV